MNTTMKNKPQVRDRSVWKQLTIRAADFQEISNAADEYGQKLADFGGTLLRGWKLLTPEQQVEALRRRAS